MASLAAEADDESLLVSDLPATPLHGAVSSVGSEASKSFPVNVGRNDITKRMEMEQGGKENICEVEHMQEPLQGEKFSPTRVNSNASCMDDKKRVWKQKPKLTHNAKDRPRGLANRPDHTLPGQTRAKNSAAPTSSYHRKKGKAKKKRTISSQKPVRTPVPPKGKTRIAKSSFQSPVASLSGSATHPSTALQSLETRSVEKRPPADTTRSSSPTPQACHSSAWEETLALSISKGGVTTPPVSPKPCHSSPVVSHSHKTTAKLQEVRFEVSGSHTSHEIRGTAAAPASTVHVHHLGHGKNAMIRSGAVRIKTPRTKPVGRATPARIGVDGTSQTPSKELLKSTTCSRNHEYRGTKPSNGRSVSPSRYLVRLEGSHTQSPQDTQLVVSHTGAMTDAIATHKSAMMSPPHISSSYLTGSVHCRLDTNGVDVALSSEMDFLSLNEDGGVNESTDSSIVRALDQSIDASTGLSLNTGSDNPVSRNDCGDPVAFTLLNDGKEDLDYLLRHDVADNFDYVDGVDHGHPDFRSPPPSVACGSFFESKKRNDVQESTVEHQTREGSVDAGGHHHTIELKNQSLSLRDDRSCLLQNVRKVSASLVDVMGDDEAATLVRPLAIVARPSPV